MADRNAAGAPDPVAPDPGAADAGAADPGAADQGLPAPRHSTGPATGDPQAGGALTRMDGWLGRRRWGVLAVLVTLALGIRASVFVELLDGPVMHSYAYSQMDMAFFDEWARRIVVEDRLGRTPLHPIHAWHEMVAAEFYQSHPERLGGRQFVALSPEGRAAAVRSIWDEWYGGTRFHQEPLYAYVLAASYALQSERDPRLIYALQALAGVGIVGLLFVAVRPVLGDLAAACAAAIAAGWGPLMHYELTLLRVSFISFAGVVVLFAAQRLLRRRGTVVASGTVASGTVASGTVASGTVVSGTLVSGTVPPGPAPLVVFGVICGLAVALKTSFALVAGGLVAARLWHQHRAPAAVLRQLGLLAAGGAVVLLPIVWRNAVVGAPLFGLTSVGPVTFVGGNVPGYDPTGGWQPYPVAAAIAAAMEASGGSLFGAMRATLGMHASIADYLELLLGKGAKILHWYEEPNNTTYYYTCVHSAVLSALGGCVATVWILPAGLVGIGLALWQRRRVGDWLWLVLCSLAPMLVFYVLSRFRAPMIVALLPFAGFTIAQTAGWLRDRRYLPAGIALAVFAALVAVVNRQGDAEPVALGAYRLAAVHYYAPRMNALRQQGDLSGAVAVLDSFLATQPPVLAELGPMRPARDDWEGSMAMEFALAYDLRVTLLDLLGDATRGRAAERERARLQAVADAYAAATRDSR